jgi:hypothetical protein
LPPATDPAKVSADDPARDTQFAAHIGRERTEVTLMPSKQTTSAPIYQLKVTLKGSKPPIWRRIQVPSDISLYKLHQILQVVMGWTDSHLYQFVVSELFGKVYYGEPVPEYGAEMKSARRMKLNQVASAEKDTFIYEYDFGDCWDHQILVEKILPAAVGVRYPLCLVGKRACPPEDCGGIWGYAELLETIKDPADPEYASMREWLDESFDPEEFDLEDVNQLLHQLTK